jgi:hypothetical protein
LSNFDLCLAALALLILFFVRGVEDMSSAVAALSSIVKNDESSQPKDNCFGCPDERTIWTRVWQGIAASSIGLNIAAMVAEGSTVVIIAGIIACMIAPVVIYLQFQIQATDST